MLQKYLAGNCTPEEEKIILKWYERLIEQSDLNLSADERNAIETRLWASIRTNTTEAEEEESMSVPGDDQQGRIVPFRRRARWTAAAIVLAIVTGGIYFYMKGRPGENQEHAAVVSAPDAYVQAVNTAKTVSRIVLADSTVILLQPNATLSYPRRFEGAAREVYLSGTAFFQVKHDPAKHFIVYTGDRLATEVLGTSFHIIQHKTRDKIEVQVMTGKVCVYQQHGRSEEKTGEATARIILTPNKKVVFNAVTNEFVTGLVDKPRPAPQTGEAQAGAETSDNRFVFEDEPLEKVLQVMSKAYSLDITAESEKLGRLHFTGNISQYDLYRQLEIICRSTKCTYEVNGEKIVLRRK